LKGLVCQAKLAFSVGRFSRSTVVFNVCQFFFSFSALISKRGVLGYGMLRAELLLLPYRRCKIGRT
jgi:hypothetical protein